ELPIIGTEEVMGFGAWASLSKDDFKLYLDKYEDPCRAHLQPMFGWLSNQLPDYPDSTWVKCTVYPQDPGLRPLLEIQPGDHPLSQHYEGGVTPEYAAAYLHKHLGI
ncbi:MAG TPA: DUF2199 domain-containing protein, partial [Allosphingosinicella sp.]|nr:DUF2199 domain-containing protein [Allosphingosinicella sp.]